MKTIWIEGSTVVNEGKVFEATVVLQGERIAQVLSPAEPAPSDAEVVDARGLHLLPGMIDDQVHFREPGLTHKGDLYTEPKAAVAGGITSFMEMPNTVPSALTVELLEQKYALAAEKSLGNYSFYMGTSNTNLSEILKVDGTRVCGVKIFMGSSTGDMLVDNEEALEAIFKHSPLLIATHCEDDPMIKQAMQREIAEYGDAIPMHRHPIIRSEEACYRSSSKAVKLAKDYGSRLHVLHISTARELSLFHNDLPLEEKRITAEACIHHLWFSDADYADKGTFIKWNPAVKTAADREALWAALRDHRIDVVATDHAPHTRAEKERPYAQAPSGGPLVQHALIAMLEVVHQEKITLPEVVSLTAHRVATLFRIRNRGFIRRHYQADLVLVDLQGGTTVTPESLHYKCGWSPFEGYSFKSRIVQTYVNGHKAYDRGVFNEDKRGQRLLFNV